MTTLFLLREKYSSVFLNRKCPHYKYFLPPCQKVKVRGCKLFKKGILLKMCLSAWQRGLENIPFMENGFLSLKGGYLPGREKYFVTDSSLSTSSTLKPPYLFSTARSPMLLCSDCGLWMKLIHLLCAQVHCGHSRLETFLILHNTSCSLQWSPGKKKCRREIIFKVFVMSGARKNFQPTAAQPRMLSYSKTKAMWGIAVTLVIQNCICFKITEITC